MASVHANAQLKKNKVTDDGKEGLHDAIGFLRRVFPDKPRKRKRMVQ